MTSNATPARPRAHLCVYSPSLHHYVLHVIMNTFSIVQRVWWWSRIILLCVMNFIIIYLMKCAVIIILDDITRRHIKFKFKCCCCMVTRKWLFLLRIKKKRWHVLSEMAIGEGKHRSAIDAPRAAHSIVFHQIPVSTFILFFFFASSIHPSSAVLL